MLQQNEIETLENEGYEGVMFEGEDASFSYYTGVFNGRLYEFKTEEDEDETIFSGRFVEGTEDWLDMFEVKHDEDDEDE